MPDKKSAKAKANNMTCTPTFLKSYPQFSENTTYGCTIAELLDYHGMLMEVFQNDINFPTPCIDYELSKEPLHGAESVFSLSCGKPSIVLYFMLKKVLVSL